MATGEFDIGATLRKRLQDITQKKESIAVSYFISVPSLGFPSISKRSLLSNFQETMNSITGIKH